MKHSRKPRMCSFCGTPQDQIQRLIAGPNVYVCDTCVTALAQSSKALQEVRGQHCSFCGKTPRQGSFLAVGPQGVSICQACLVLCQEILAEGHPR